MGAVASSQLHHHAWILSLEAIRISSRQQRIQLHILMEDINMENCVYGRHQLKMYSVLIQRSYLTTRRSYNTSNIITS